MRIGICGYGNLGRGVELALQKNGDMEAVGVFTHRPEIVRLQSRLPVYAIERLTAMQDAIDVLILCGGSAEELPRVTPQRAAFFNVVDSFDRHSDIPAHFDRVDAAARQGGRVALVCAGWDPGLFSIQRLMGEALLPEGQSYTFWGRGVSQGHSEALRHIRGVKEARQYTVPDPEAIKAARCGERTGREPARLHRRECYIVAEEGVDRARIETEIRTMPGYFDGYETKIQFITEAEMAQQHAALPHGGHVIRNGATGPHGERGEQISYSLKLDSNPEFTASVLTAYARAVYRLYLRGERGARSVLDIAPADLSPLPAAEQRARFL